jgi:hypothetical protein
LSATSPLSAAEIDRLDATLLPALERHHLRLLAHALRTLQQVQRHTHSPHMPGPAAIEQWLLEQPGLSQDPDFCRQLAMQLHSAGHPARGHTPGAGAGGPDQLGPRTGRPAAGYCSTNHTPRAASSAASRPLNPG